MKLPLPLDNCPSLCHTEQMQIETFYSGPIITRKKATLLKQASYFTGVPCIYGHIDQRTIRHGDCRRCKYLRKEKKKPRYSDEEIKLLLKQNRPKIYDVHHKGTPAFMKNKIMQEKPKLQICEICSSETKIVFDHCHKTGKFRGWICSSCNSALGFAYDNINILKAMITYLEKQEKTA